MPISKKVVKFLTANKIKYETISHRTVYTAYDKAVTLRVKPNMIGKTLILKIDKEIVVVLLPGNKNLDKDKFKKTVNDWRKKSGQKLIKKVDFISEKIMKNKFKGIKIGAIPPFGNLWKIQTFIDKGLIKSPKIIINSGDYNWSIKIAGTAMKKILPDLAIGSFSKSK